MTYIIKGALNYNAIENLGAIDFNQDHEFDLSNVTFVKPDGVVFLRLLLHEICINNNCNVLFHLPKNNNDKYDVRQYLSHIDFFKGLSLKFSSKDYLYLKGRKFLPSIIQSTKTHTKLIDSNEFGLGSKNLRILVFVLINFLTDHDMVRQDKENTYRMVFEEAFLNQRNHSNHGDAPAYFCAHAQVYKKDKPKIVLALGDCGVGIKASLNTEYSFKNDKVALEAAVLERTSRFVENSDRGGGLRLIFDKCRDLKLNCRIKSGEAVIEQLKGRQDFQISISTYLPGTQLMLWN